MLIASILAVILHIGFINFEFAPKPALVPRVSLPRSVSVSLGQRSMVESPVPIEKTQIDKPLLKKQPAAEPEPEKSPPQKLPTIKDKGENSFRQPLFTEKVAKQPAVEKNIPTSLRSENIEKTIVTEPGEAVNVQESETPSTSQIVLENEGETLPGTLQLAYPRYQLNTPPAYPGLARKRGQEGTVILQVLVNRDGGVDDLEIETSSGSGVLDRAAVSAVRKWSFEPGMRGEEMIPMWVRVPVTFKLKQ